MDSVDQEPSDVKKEHTSVDGDHAVLDQTSKSKSIPDIASVDLKTIHGPLNDFNHFTLNYSVTGFVAFGCQNVVVVLDSKSPNRAAQALVKHKDSVCVLKWINSTINDGIDVNLMKLASGDVKGNIVVWDVIRGASICIIRAESSNILRETQNILCFEWTKCPSQFMSSSNSSPSKVHLSPRKFSRDSLLVLYPKNVLVLYDSDSGQIIWKKQLFAPSSSLNALTLLTKSTNSNQHAINCTSFSIDPYDGDNLILTVSSFDMSHEPCSFIVMNNCFSSVLSSLIDDKSSSLKCTKYSLFVTDFVQQSSPTSSPDLKLQLLCQDYNQMSFAFEPKPSNKSSRSPTPIPSIENQFVVELKHVCYNKSRIDEVIVASSRVITMVNLKMDQVIATIPLERNCSNLLAIHSCFQRNAMFTCHKSGSIYLRTSQKKVRFDGHTSSEVIDISYMTVASSEPLKMSKDTNVVGFSVSPLDETRMCLVLSNGKVILNHLIKAKKHECNHLSDMIPISGAKVNETLELKEDSRLSALNKPVIIKSCPPVTKSNWSIHRPLIAVGDFNGSIQIYDMKDGSIAKEYECLHGNQVRGIEWSSLTCFLSWSYPPISPTPHDIKTTNELMITDILTCHQEAMRKDRNIDSSPIQGIKVSHLKQYFIISFKSDPPEIWDLKNLSLLKIMSTFTSPITAIEWSPISSSKKSGLMSTSAFLSEEIKDRDTLQQILPPSNPSSMATSYSDISCLSKENFVISSSSGDLYHYSIGNVVVKEISVIHGDYSHGYLTSIAWKENVVVLGFQDGNLLIWDLKKKESKSKQTHSKEVVRKIKFGPGKGNPNFLVLYKDYLEMWDLTDLQVISQMKSSTVSCNDVQFNIIDFDWIGSDRPVILTSTGLLLVTDLFLSKHSTSMNLAKSISESGLQKCNYFMLKDNLKFPSLINFIRDGGNGFKSPSVLLNKCLEASIISGSSFHFAFWSLVGHHILNYDNLDHVFEPYLSNETFRKIQEERVSCYESIETGFHPVICEYHHLLGHNQRSVQMLLESDSTSPDIYLKNGLRACLISSIQENKEKHSGINEASTVEPVIKLVAASLIASGAVDDGVQLLYLIDKIFDSCRYLQSNGQWKKSIWVAKSCLDEEKSHEFLKRWSDYLVQEDQETREEILIQLSMKQYEKVLVSLVNRYDVQTAALFIKLWRMSDCFPQKESSSIEGTFEFVFCRYLSLLKGHQVSEEILRDLNQDHVEKSGEVK